MLAVVGSMAVACDDGLGPQVWDDTPSTFALYSASRPELLGFPSAYDFVNLQPTRIESPGSAGNWDVVLATAGAQLQLIPAGAFEGQTSRAGIATITGQTFANVTSAPSDTAAFSSQPVTLQAGGIYVVRTRRYACSYGTAVNYAKIEVLTVNPAQGTATFNVVRNPYCNDRSFVPPED